MSRTLSILILLIAVLGAFLIFRNVTESNKENTTVSNTPNLTQDKSQAVSEDSHYENWKEFTSQTGNFKVLFPILPQHATDKILDPETREMRKYDMYVAANDAGTVFMISAITFPNGIQEKDRETILASAVNEMLARNKDNKLRMLKGGHFHNFQSADFSIDNGEINLGGKAFIQGNTLYVLNVISKQGTFDPRDLDFFVNSFNLIDSQKNANENGKN